MQGGYDEKRKFADRYGHLYRELKIGDPLVIIEEDRELYRLSGIRYAPRSQEGYTRTFCVLKEKVRIL